MSKTNENLIREFAAECKSKIEEFERTEVRCGLIGPSGSGKSSLINAIAGEKIAAVGVVETTNQPQEFTRQGIIFTDLPGCGTPSWPRHNYIQRLQLESYDCFLLVTAHRFQENDLYLFQELSALGKPCFVIRNMVDRAIEDARHDNNQAEADTMEQIRDDIRRQLPPLPDSSVPKIYLTSARHPTRYDLQELLQDISRALQGVKQSRFVADMAIYGEQTLKKKREIALGRLRVYAGLSAANGLNPVPGMDIATDLTLMVKLGREIAHIYGLTSNQFDYIKRLLGPKAIPSLLAKIAQFGAKYLAKEGILLVLRKIATRTTAKHVSKWIPFVGPLISTRIGWKATFILGEQLVDEAEDLARDILKEIAKQNP